MAVSSNSNQINKDRIGIYGGSYGGYLATRLPQLYPNTYKCSVILNPVTDILFNKTITDIPEWNHAESLNIHKDDSYPLTIN
jgi:acylaminoacyl-peptidase